MTTFSTPPDPEGTGLADQPNQPDTPGVPTGPHDVPDAGDALDAPATVPHALPCTRCGYLLKGQLVDGHCSECGAPIAESLRPDRLVFEPARYLARLRNGAAVVSISVVLMLVLIGWLGLLIGSLMLLIDRDGDSSVRLASRRVAGVLLGITVASIIVAMATFFTSAADYRWSLLLSLIWPLMLYGHMTAMTWYAAHLGRRGNAPSLKQSSVIFTAVAGLTGLASAASTLLLFVSIGSNTMTLGNVWVMALSIGSHMLQLLLFLLYALVMGHLALDLHKQTKRARTYHADAATRDTPVL